MNDKKVIANVRPLNEYAEKAGLGPVYPDRIDTARPFRTKLILDATTTWRQPKMSFVNEKLTEEDKKEYLDFGVISPITNRPWGSHGPWGSPEFWTIDRDKKMWLIGIGIGIRDLPNEQLFAFMCNANIYYFQLHCEYVNAKKIWSKPAQENCVYGLDNAIYSDDAQLIENIRKAINAYKLDGFNNPHNLNSEVEIRF